MEGHLAKDKDKDKDKVKDSIFIQDDDSDTCFDFKKKTDDLSLKDNYDDSESSSIKSEYMSGQDSDDEREGVFVYWKDFTDKFKKDIMNINEYTDEKLFMKDYNIKNIALTYLKLTKN